VRFSEQRLWATTPTVRPRWRSSRLARDGATEAAQLSLGPTVAAIQVANTFEYEIILGLYLLMRRRKPRPLRRHSVSLPAGRAWPRHTPRRDSPLVQDRPPRTCRGQGPESRDRRQRGSGSRRWPCPSDLGDLGRAQPSKDKTAGGAVDPPALGSTGYSQFIFNFIEDFPGALDEGLKVFFRVRSQILSPDAEGRGTIVVLAPRLGNSARSYVTCCHI
jgi:hypothetical protein